MKRRAAGLAVGLAILVAAYTGVRMPDRWSVTLQAVSIFDGIHRRFLVGTVLRPFTALFGYDYRLFALFSFAVLTALLYVIWRAAVRSELWSKQLLVIGWLVLPAGGFLFDEVGFLEQVVYLMLALAVWLAGRERLRGAAVVLALTPCVHELAILTVVPLFAAVCVRSLPPRRVALLLVPAVAVAAILLLVPHTPQATIDHLEVAWTRDGFPYREDALQLFVRTQAESWELYSFWAAMRIMMPVTVLLLVATAALANRRDDVAFAAALGAVVAPLLLIYGGWDVNRWTFFAIANFAVIVWIAIDRELVPRAAAILVGVALLLARRPLGFIDAKPRELDAREVARFADEITSGTIFEIPDL
ncbi:MAG: hypothetical protein ABJE66_24870 [Deltaproteobacteria bacterium]